MNSKLSKLLKHWGKMREEDEGCGATTTSIIKNYYFSDVPDQKASICRQLTGKHGYGNDSCHICIFSAVPDDNFPMNQLVEEICQVD